jgi:hypothetical protein
MLSNRRFNAGMIDVIDRIKRGSRTSHIAIVDLQKGLTESNAIDAREIYRPEQMVGLGFVYTNLGGTSNSA